MWRINCEFSQARGLSHVDEVGPVKAQQTSRTGHPNNSVPSASHLPYRRGQTIRGGEIGKFLPIKRENHWRCDESRTEPHFPIRRSVDCVNESARHAFGPGPFYHLFAVIPRNAGVGRK